MEDIKDVNIEPLKTSNYVKPFRMNYTQNGKKKIWDLICVHESVSIIIFNTDRKKLLFVKQFRPAVFYNSLPEESRTSPINTDQKSCSEGVTLELCAGIVDKNVDLVEIAKEEVVEECGYNAPIDQFEKIITYRAGVGVSGERQSMFYVEVTDKMKVSEGGGVADEGELIDVVEMSITEAKSYLAQDDVISPGAFLFGLLWFLQNKAAQYSDTDLSATT